MVRLLRRRRYDFLQFAVRLNAGTQRVGDNAKQLRRDGLAPACIQHRWLIAVAVLLVIHRIL
jgi:hypothetical protein